MSKGSERADEIERYRERVRTPRVWQDTARDLVWSANKLRAIVERRVPLGFSRRGRLSEAARLSQRHHSFAPAIVLYVYAIENLLKALLVARGVDPVGRTGRLDKKFATHSLWTLAKAARFRVQNKAALHQLTDFAYSGKYPVGMDPDSGFSARSYFPSAVLTFIDRLLPRLEQAVENTRHPDALPATDPLALARRPKKRRKRKRRITTG